MEQPKGKVSTRRPAVLQIVPELDTGGAERTTVDVAAALVREGWRAIVLSRGGRLVGELEKAGGEHMTFKAASKNPVTILANALRLRKILLRENVGIIHARSRAPAWSAFLAARMTGTPFVTTHHGSYNQRGRLKAFYNSVMARGDVVIANSCFIARLISERHPVAGDRIVVIHRGTDLDGFAAANISGERVEAMRKAWGVSAGDRVVLQMARLTGWKGQTVLIDAVAQIAGDFPNMVAILAGDAQGRDGYVAELTDRIATAGLDGKVRLVGHCGDVPAAMAVADISVVASTEPEAFGRAAVEAQAGGVPVIVSNLGAVPETVLAPPEVSGDERTGWRVPPGDSGALAQAMRTALTMPDDTRQTMIVRARDHVTASFSLEAMTGATLEQYRRLLES